ncbi:hypothetical protein [Saccharothrix obliqua]|uniref:hypothetical protein n=1 Tax=Saccharothrix obliqua TaxID=2861747 RepID=UPI001C5F82AF|nr:hypothetical protein [Saccharothrix obliqua]MBW4716107.1 hypothetical protein [Saccharothrix obliqua]
MRGRSAALGVVVGVVSPLVTAGVAMAGTSTAALGASSVNTPVGVAAVAVGVVGLVAGLVRRRRAAVVRAKSEPETPAAAAQPAVTLPAPPTTTQPAPTRA